MWEKGIPEANLYPIPGMLRFQTKELYGTMKKLQTYKESITDYAFRTGF